MYVVPTLDIPLLFVQYLKTKDSNVKFKVIAAGSNLIRHKWANTLTCHLTTTVKDAFQERIETTSSTAQVGQDVGN